MPLPVPQVGRELLHTRRVRYEGYKRADGLWDIEACLTDVKSHDFQLETGLRRAGDTVHDIAIRVTIDASFTIVDVATATHDVPYPGACDAVGPAYRKLVGLCLAKGFRRQVRALLGGVQGCTHLTELVAGLPTAAIQSRAGELRAGQQDAGEKPFQLDHCHALDTRSETVRRWYPKWYKREKTAV